MPTTPDEPPAPAPRLADVVRLLEASYPPSTAEDWDAVGLVCGDPGREVRSVLLAVDPVAEVVDEALELGADLLVVHHPLLLRPVSSVAATTPKGRVVHRLIEAGCALYVAHTSADSARPGVSDALARVVGLDDLRPLVPAEGSPDTGLGRVGVLPEPMSLERFALVVAEALPHTPQGVRVAGDLEADVRTVAVCGGSGDSLFDAVRASGADVFLTADLRHHPASEAREAALDPTGGTDGDGRPFLVDVAHWASEWPWLHGAADALHRGLEGSGTSVETRVSIVRTDPWTVRLPSSGGVVR